MTDYPHVVNPSAIGNPDETPVLHVPVGEAGDFLRWAAQNNALLIAMARVKCANEGHDRFEADRTWCVRCHSTVVAE